MEGSQLLGAHPKPSLGGLAQPDYPAFNTRAYRDQHQAPDGDGTEPSGRPPRPAEGPKAAQKEAENHGPPSDQRVIQQFSCLIPTRWLNPIRNEFRAGQQTPSVCLEKSGTESRIEFVTDKANGLPRSGGLSDNSFFKELFDKRPDPPE